MWCLVAKGSGGEPGPRQPEGEPGHSPEVNQTVHSLHTEEATGSEEAQGLLGNICTAAGGHGGRGHSWDTPLEENLRQHLLPGFLSS